MGLLLILAYVGFAFWLAALRPERALLGMVFLIPWGALYTDFGLWVNAYQIMMLALLLCTFARSLQPGWTGVPMAAGRLLALLLLWALLTSLLQVARVPDVALKTTGLRGPTTRAIIQMAMYTFSMSPMLLVLLWVRSTDALAAMARTYVLSALLLAVIGWLQLVVWVGTGTNPMPVDFFNTWVGGQSTLREGVVQFGKINVFRMNSFAGEPRTLGGALVYAMLIIQAVGAISTAVPRRKLVALWLFLAVSTIATLSTSAVLIWSIGSIVQFPLARLFGVRLRVSGPRIALMLGAVMLPFGLAAAAIEASGFPIFDLLAQRTIERIDASGAVEDFDLAIISYFQAHPLDSIAGVGLGNAHLYAQRYIDPEFQWYALGGVFTAKTQYLRLISEIGFIGLGLFLLWYLVLLIDAAVAVRRLPVLAPIMSMATVTIVIFFASGQFIAEFYHVAGALGALCAVANRQRSGAPPPQFAPPQLTGAAAR